MFWTRASRAARRQKVLDELLGLDPAERRGHLEVAVAAGDVRADEVDSALLLVQRLDALRVMTIPPSGLLPGGVLPVTEHPLRAPEDVTATVPAGPSVDRGSIEDDAAEISGRPGLIDPARKPRAGTRSSRQRRLKNAIAARPEGRIESKSVPRRSERLGV